MNIEKLETKLEHTSHQQYITVDGFLAQITREHIDAALSTPHTLPYPVQARWGWNIPYTHIDHCDMWQTCGTDMEGRRWRGGVELLIARLRQRQLTHDPTAPHPTVIPRKTHYLTGEQDDYLRCALSTLHTQNTIHVPCRHIIIDVNTEQPVLHITNSMDMWKQAQPVARQLHLASICLDTGNIFNRNTQPEAVSMVSRVLRQSPTQ